jgi:hypothetical protein
MESSREGKSQRGKAILRRLLRYAEKIFHLSDRVIAQVSDSREAPRIATESFVRAGLVMFWLRLGSLNALAGTAESSFWKKWLGRDLPSSTSMGRVYSKMVNDGYRTALRNVYTTLKRNKAFRGIGGIHAAIIDGHERTSSYLRHCDGCLERVKHTVNGDRIQYYHRDVTIMIAGERYRYLLDVEPQLPGEDEVAAAKRLLERVLTDYPRAFQLVIADALYGQAPFINFLRSRRKHVLIVLKDERRELYQDVVPLFNSQKPKIGRHRSSDCLWWDEEGFSSWDGLNESLRVVRSVEKTRIKRQATDEIELKESEWLWLTSLPQAMVSTDLVVRLGHARWDVENHGFNHLVNAILADHVYKHDPIAIEAFALLSFLAVNLLLAFFTFNVKEPSSRSRTSSYWARVLSAEIHIDSIRLNACHSP